MEIVEGNRFEDIENDVEEPKDAVVDAPVETEEELTPEALAGEETQEAQPESEPEITPYTPEEIENLLREEDANVDFRRLSPEGQAIFKSVDRGLKPKLQERAELKRRLEEVERSVGGRQPQQRTIEDDFKENPQGVLSGIRQMIAEKEQTDPFGTEISHLRNAYNYYTERLLTEQYTATKQAQERSAAYEMVAEHISDFSPKQREEMSTFAVEKLGMTNDFLLRVTDPDLVGKESAALAVIAIANAHKLYKSSQGNVIAKKEVKTPTKVESAGNGFKAENPPVWNAEAAIMARHKGSFD